MPISIVAFLIYALLLLAGLGLTLGRIVEQATNAPITLQGVVWMALIAACIFSITLVIQRKGRGEDSRSDSAPCSSRLAHSSRSPLETGSLASHQSFLHFCSSVACVAPAHENG